MNSKGPERGFVLLFGLLVVTLALKGVDNHSSSRMGQLESVNSRRPSSVAGKRAMAVDALVAKVRAIEADQSKSEQTQLTSVVVNLEVLSERAERLICLSKQWFEVDATLGMLMSTFQEHQRSAFESGSDSPQNADCFYPELVSDSGKEQMARILQRVDTLTKNQTAVMAMRDSKADVNGSLAKKFQLEKQDNPHKLWRAEKVIGGSEAVGLAVLLLVPQSISKWEKSPLQPWKFKRAWTTAPVWDHDLWYINYIGHPVTGAFYYNSLRSQGGGILQSFVFSTAQSATWEYLIEGWAEQPSIQDLIFTSTLGAVLGEGAHQATLQMRKGGFKFWEKAIVTLINPMYVIMNGYK